MKTKKQLFIITLFFIIFTYLFPENLPNSDKLITGKLQNGITYYIYKNKKPENKASLNLVVRTGSLMENDNEQGIAHFLEHMAFNGTTKYKKNDMIKYLQSIGLNFGGDLNAYTTFDRTVYTLLVPTQPKDLESGIEVLREWATNVTLNSEDIDSEKKIIIEEWRLSQGLKQRIWDIRKKALFENSRYYDRFPIGLPEIINGADKSLLEGFYKRWYQPQNISVVAVGDFDVKKVTALIEKYFNYKEPEKLNTPPEFKIGELTDKYITFSDPEIRYNTLFIDKLLKRDVVNTTEALKLDIMDQLIFGIINSRMNELIKKDNSPLIDSIIESDPFNNSQSILETQVVFKDNRISDGISLIISLMENIEKNGLTQNELNLEKENLYISYKDVVKNRDSIPHDTFAEKLVEYITAKESFMELNKEFDIATKLMNEITLQEINDRVKSLLSSESVYFLTTSTKQNKLNNEELKSLILKTEKSPLSLDFNIKQITLDKEDIVPGKIKSQTGENFVLSNGIKVFTKNTNFDKDKIFIHLLKKEGSSVDNYDEYINSLLASPIILSSAPSNIKAKDLETFMKGKNFSIKSYINDYEQGIEITTDKKNFDLSLEYMNALIRKPKVDDNIFNNTIENTKTSITNRNNSPKNVYIDEISKIYSGNNIRRKPLSLEDLKLVTKDGVLNEFKKKFSNFNGFDLIIVGSLDGINLKESLEKYFASLNSTNDVVKPISLNIAVPKDVVKKKVIKGIDKKALTTIIFPYNSSYNFKNKTLYAGFSDILDMALIEEIREKIGGVYSIGSYTTLSPNNYGEDKLVISYSSDPARVQEIEKAVLKTISNLLSKPINHFYIESVVKNYELNYNTNVKENSFWKNYLYNKSVIDNYKLATPKEFKKLMNSKDILKVNRKAINLKNYISITLIPEKDKI